MTKKKRGQGQQKGARFEREICKLLSLWWTGDERDDIFWRSSGSGARATVRGRKGQRTFGQSGDVQATDPLGQPLINLCVIEIKRGYSKVSIGDMLDRKESSAEQQWETWVKQVNIDRITAERPFWLLITARTRREPIIFMPWSLAKHLRDAGAKLYTTYPQIRMRLQSRVPVLDKLYVFGMRLSEFFRIVHKEHCLHAEKYANA